MSEADARKPIDKTRRAVVIATAGIVVIFGLLALYLFMAAPLWQVHATLRDWDEDRISSDEAMKRLGEPPRSVRRLAIYLRLPRWMGANRQYAALALGRIGPEAKAAVPALVKALGDRNAHVRADAASALYFIGPAAKTAVPALIGLLGDTDRYVRHWAVVALGKIGPEARKAVPALVKILEDEDTDVQMRSWAAQALGGIGPDAKAAVPVLVKALVEALGDPGAVDPFMDLTRRDYVQAASWALDRTGPAVREAVPMLISMLERENLYERLVAAKELGRIGPEAQEAISALEKLLKDPSKDVCRTAAEALKKIRGEE